MTEPTTTPAAAAAARVAEARRVLAEFDAETRAAAEAQQAAAAAEQQRQAERRQRWAAGYLPTAEAERLAAMDERRAAEQAFRDALAAEPWVIALVRWQAAANEVPAAVTRAGHARHTLGQSASIDERAAHPLVTYLDGQPTFPEFWRALDAITGAAPYDPMGAVDAAIAAPDGPGDPLAGA